MMDSEPTGPPAGPTDPGGIAGTTVTPAVAGVASGVASGTRRSTSGEAGDPAIDWVAFDKAVGSAFEQMRLVGGAVAVVSADRVLHTVTCGVQNLGSGRPVTDDTVFAAGSATKSMTAAFVATYVDEQRIGWDQKCIDAWPGFRAASDEMTRTLRVRDLLGMGSGLEEPDSTSLHFGGPTAAELCHALSSLLVIAEQVDQKFSYNNTVYAVGGYLPLLATGVAPVDLSAAYADGMHDRVFAPAGMTDARIASDPRGRSVEYATGYGFDLSPEAVNITRGATGGYAPAGGALATLTDMAAWVRLQLRQGSSVGGGRVVSAANLAECWKPHVTVPLAPDLDPDAVKAGYGMGWLREEYQDGTSLVWHNGAIDGFTTYMAFLPQHDLGLVVLNNMTAGPTGTLWYTYVRNLLLSQRFGLNSGVTEEAIAESTRSLGLLAGIGRDARPADNKVIDPYLGYYDRGYSLVFERQDLKLRIGPRMIPLQVRPDGSYVMSAGFMVGVPVKLARESDGTPHLEIVGFETVRQTMRPT